MGTVSQLRYERNTPDGRQGHVTAGIVVDLAPGDDLDTEYDMARDFIYRKVTEEFTTRLDEIYGQRATGNEQRAETPARPAIGMMERKVQRRPAGKGLITQRQLVTLNTLAVPSELEERSRKSFDRGLDELTEEQASEMIAELQPDDLDALLAEEDA